MRNEPTYSIPRNGMAAGLMLASVIGFSIVPLLVALGDGESPFIFAAAWKIGVAATCALILTVIYRSLVFSGSVWKVIWLRIASLPMLFWIINYFDTALYAWSTQFIDVSITAVLYETWPILLVILASWLFRDETRYRKITPMSVFLLVIAFVGVASVIGSQAGGIANLAAASTELPSLALGVFLVLAAALLTALTAFGFRWAVDLASDLPNDEGRDSDSLELFSTVVGLAIVSLINFPLTALAGFARNEPVSLTPIAFGATGGVLVGAIVVIVWRKANLISHNLELNVMVYLTPVAALGWLFAFSLVGDVSLGYLAIGLTMIVAANVGLYIELRPSRDPARATAQIPQEVDLDALVTGGESDAVEFKSTLRMNLHTNKRDDRMTFAALRTLAAFLNTDGGTLIIGVADDRTPVGIDKDDFRSEDDMSLYLRNRVTDRMGATVMTYVKLEYADYAGSRALAVRCEPSDTPVYVRDGNVERFYIRTGPSTTEPPTSELYDYIRRRF